MNEKVIDNRERVAIKYIFDTLSKELIANNCTLHSILKIVAELGKAFNQISALDANFDYFDHGLKFFALCFCEKPMHIDGHLAGVISDLLFGDNAENAIQNAIDRAFCWRAHLIHDYKFDEEKYEEMLKEIDALKDLIETKMSWIPVSERLPGTSGEALICDVYGYMTIAEFCVIDKQFHDRFNGCVFTGVVAWMPLPEPYKAN